VKAIVRRKLSSEKRSIEPRLEGAVRVNEGGPVLSAGNIDYEIARCDSDPRVCARPAIAWVLAYPSHPVA